MNTHHISSYPSIYALGHRAIKEILSGPVVIEEKVDGSQFSMSRNNGVLSCRSKGVDIVVDAPEKLFLRAVESAKALDLRDGWIYRCEYLNAPKHNTLAYTRIPKSHLIVFDVCTGPETYLTPSEKLAECARIGLECVPCYHEGPIEFTMATAEQYLHNDSALGGCKVEGFVIKNYALFTPDKKIAIAKYVSASFKEKHQVEWKRGNPSEKDVIQLLIAELKTDARWNKAIQHLRDDGKLEESPKDIGLLMKEVPDDILKDSEAEIKERLFNHFWPQIRRGVTCGLPEYYKAKLAETVLTP